MQHKPLCLFFLSSKQLSGLNCFSCVSFHRPHICLCKPSAPNSHVFTQQTKALKMFIFLSDQKYCDPLNTPRVHCVMRGISFLPRQKRWHHWSHLMCALNIRWGRKGSIQEFSTLLRAPGLPSPFQPSQATLRTRTGWNRPPSPQQQQHKQSQLRVHWLTGWRQNSKW